MTTIPKDGIELDIIRAPFAFGFDLYAVEWDHGTGRRGSVGQPVTMVPIVGLERPHAPTLHLEHDAVQMLMDALWGFGIRPSEMRQQDVPVETLKAKEANLADLRNTIDFLKDTVVGLRHEARDAVNVLLMAVQSASQSEDTSHAR